MYDKMCNIMVQATSRSVHHAFSKYLDMAHGGQQIVITKRGKPWARLEPIPAPKADKPRKLDWNKVFDRTRENFKGRKVEAVKAYLKMREEARW
jgi:prevent-host-death family protein